MKKMNSYFDQQITRLSKSLILLADDDDDDRFLMNEFFTSNGYKSKIVSSGLAVLDFLQSLSPNLYPSVVLLDYTMPLLNGEDVLLLIKASDKLKDIPVIIYSSEMNDHLKSHLEAIGAYACFSKAWQASELSRMKNTIESLLYSKRNFQFEA